MQTFVELLSESILAKSVKVNKSNEPLNPIQMKSYVNQYRMVSNNFSDDYENIIGTITFDNNKRHIEYVIFELDSHDKKEFGDVGVYGISSQNMVQARSIVKVQGTKISFLDNDKYADDGEVVFNDSVKIKALNVFNKKYYSKF